MSRLPSVHNPLMPNDLSQGADSGCTDGCTPEPENAISDPNLIRLIELWPSLPAIERFAVLEFVEKSVEASHESGSNAESELGEFQSA